MQNRVWVLVLLGSLLALLTWGAVRVVDATTQRWYASDVRLRAELAFNAARARLVDAWRAHDGRAIAAILEDITRDERIVATAACDVRDGLLTATSDYPLAALPCASLARHLGAPTWAPWDGTLAVDGRHLHVSVLPVVDGGRMAGFVVVVHDLAYALARVATERGALVLVLALFGVAAAGITVFIERASWRRWSREIRRAFLGEPASRREFGPLARELRALVAELRDDRAGGAWDPERLRATLRRHLDGERLIVVSNREPYIHNRDGDGALAVQHPASGLVTALEPVMRACSGVWIAHGSGSADRDVVDRHAHVRVPPGAEAYDLRRVWLTPDEERGYYYGFANEGLWPLCHLAHARPTFRGEDWAHYRAVNQRFADAVVEEADGDDPVVLVQDYHFALAPAMIRARLPRATILSFWHIPWPNAERVGICPWREELVEGLLGSSIVGFHTQQHCNNFLETVDGYLEARVDREQNAVVQHGRATLVRPYPISIEWPSRWVDDAPSVEECRARVRAEIGAAPDAILGVGVDRLDYTKGIEERLLAVERLLEQQPRLRGRFVFAQIAAPSRTEIARYRELARAVDEIAERVNRRFGGAGYRPVTLARAHHEPEAVFRYYRAADVCYVSSLHDGMNLVAKEFVAARDDERGVLVLSHFTGAARELGEALLVNPYDLDEASAALAAAVLMPASEQRERMRAMRSWIAEHNVYRWAGRLLADAAQLRQRERRRGRMRVHVASVDDAREATR